MSIAIYPGSFDPLTNGHIYLIKRGLQVFQKIVVAVLNNPKKTPCFSVEQRKSFILESLSLSKIDGNKVEVDSFSGLLVKYCKSKKIYTVIRGLRAVSDFEYEFQMANMNRKLCPEFEAIFMMTGEDHFFTSSQLVREIASLGGNVKDLVPLPVFTELQKKFSI